MHISIESVGNDLCDEKQNQVDICSIYGEYGSAAVNGENGTTHSV